MPSPSLYERARDVSFERDGEPRRVVCARLENPSAPTFLLLHGNPGRMDDLADLAHRLAERGEVFALDLPGFGRSPTPSGSEGLSLEAQADDVAATLDAIGIERPCVVLGHSHGGGVAHVLAARHPRRVARVIGVGSLGHPAHGSYRLLRVPGMERVGELLGHVLGVRWMREPLRRVFAAAMQPIFAPATVDPAEVETQLELFRKRPELLVNMVRLTQGDPCRTLLAAATHVEAPTLYLHGRHEQLVPPSHVRSLHRTRRGLGLPSTLRLLDGGHMLPVYQVDELVAAIDEWLVD